MLSSLDCFLVSDLTLVERFVWGELGSGVGGSDTNLECTILSLTGICVRRSFKVRQCDSHWSKWLNLVSVFQQLCHLGVIAGKVLESECQTLHTVSCKRTFRLQADLDSDPSSRIS